MAEVKPLTNSETAAFCSQMAMILKSGISSGEGLILMSEDAAGDEEKKILEAANQVLMETGSLHHAVKATGIFPDYMVSMVRIGEETGTLDTVMQSLSAYYSREAGLAQTIKNAITYPFIMILLMIAVILILLTKVMPTFAQVFAQLGMSMGTVAKVFLAAGSFFSRNIIVLLILLVLLAALAGYFTLTSSGQKAFLRFAGSLKPAGRLSEQISAYRFASGMALTLSSGLTPETSMEMACELVEDSAFASKLNKCRSDVSAGRDLCRSLLENHIFSGVNTRLVSIASKTGGIDQAMDDIALQYEEEIDRRVESMLASIEPTLVIILSVLVGAILLSVMLPLLSIMSSL